MIIIRVSIITIETINTDEDLKITIEKNNQRDEDKCDII